ncbi:MAG TPA: class I SAM-dependent methyltransferase, partial [Candidatus Blautia stercoripullorum]|nr:class I SAM-dependent methyltransferase [Candidatus Blautia stercoripullorum]
KGDRKGRFNGRYFYDYNRESLNDLLDSFPEIQVIDIWKTSDVREDRNNKWFNVLLRKRREE